MRNSEKLLADFLNRVPNHDELSRNITALISEAAHLSHGGTVYKTTSEFMDFLEGASKAIASEYGFIAKPVVLIGENDERFCAVALCSKLEDYISWCYIVTLSPDEHIESIRGVRPNDYCIFYEPYLL